MAAHVVFTIMAVALGATTAFMWDRQREKTTVLSPTHTYTTLAGQQATVTLADGSRVNLGPATTLSVTAATSSSEESMDVHVVGQALFTVAHHANRSFHVRTGSAVARVLGTAFLVRQYATDRVARIVVTEGRVSLSGVRNTANVSANHVLTANMLGIVDDSGQVKMIPNIRVEEYIGWTKGQLVFQDTPARDVVADLGRAYDVDIRIVDSTRASQPLSWTVPVARWSVTHVLELLGDALDVHPVRRGRVIILVPGKSESTLQRPTSPRSLSHAESQNGK
jgi:transmembrane sensor